MHQDAAHWDMPAEQYRAASGINQSGLKDILESPSYFQYRRQHPSPSSAAAELGTLAHLAVLEPAVFAKTVIVAPSFKSKSGTTLKKQAADWASDNGHEKARIVSQVTMDQLIGMRTAVFANTKAKTLLANGRAEASLFWGDDTFGVQCKARADFITEYAGGAVVDLKTAASITPNDFQRALVDPRRRYDLQAAHYLDAGRKLGLYAPDLFFFIAVTSEAPYDCVVYLLDDQAISLGRSWRDHAMATYSECLESGLWPSRAEIETLGPPAWAKPPVLT